MDTSNDLNSFKLTELPWVIQLRILKKLSYCDILTLKKVSKYFAHIIEQEHISWIKDVSLANAFPNPENMSAFSWLSAKGNIEATIKLGISALYRESLADTAEQRVQNSIQAAEYFCAMEQSGMLKAPLTWVFIRPPWSSASVCRKAYVTNHIVEMVGDGLEHRNLLYCIAKIYQLFQDNSQKQALAEHKLKRASELGLPDATYELWKMKLSCSTTKKSIEAVFSSLEPGTRLSSIRELREIAARGHEPAKIQLYRLYMSGHHEGLSSEFACKAVKRFFVETKPLHSKPFESSNSTISSHMRYILIDWLVEVATMKEFSSETLHSTVQCLDRYLRLRKVSRSQLQLLGIACMVICSRSMEKDVLTIREAVWLTDSAYKYEELVRMMEDVVAALKGNIKNITTWDCLSILLKMEGTDRRVVFASQFLADSSLLYSDASIISPAIVASSCLLLANLTNTPENNPWSRKMEEITGFTSKELRSPTLTLHENCIAKQSPVSQDSSTTATEERYNRGTNGSITRMQIINYDKVLEFFHATNNTPLMVLIPPPPIEPARLGSSGMSRRVYVVEEPETLIDSSDEEFDNHTPPTLSCTYLVRNDSKTRKRIRDDIKDSNRVFPGDRSQKLEPDANMNSKSQCGATAKVHTAGNQDLSHEAAPAEGKENSLVLVEGSPNKLQKISNSPEQRESGKNFPQSSKSIKFIR